MHFFCRDEAEPGGAAVGSKLTGTGSPSCAYSQSLVRTPHPGSAARKAPLQRKAEREDPFGALASQWQRGDRQAGGALFSALDRELRVVAAAHLRRERNSSLSTGDLINEAILRLSQLKVMTINGRSHVLALASRLMRRVLIDKARRNAASKRCGDCVTLRTEAAQWELPVDIMALELALNELSQIDEERARIVEMRFYGGMSTEDIAEVLDISEATVKRRWAATRSWLHARLGG